MDTHLTLVSAWRELLLSFSPVFTEPSTRTFVQLLSAWVLCSGRHALTGMLPFVEPQETRSHDAFHRFLSQAQWETKELWRRWTCCVVGLLAPTGKLRLDLDDTLFHKSGSRVAGAGWWRDPVRSTGTRVVHAFGLNLLVLTLRVQPPWGGEPLGLPLYVRLHRKGERGLLDLAEEMLREVAAWLPQRWFTLCADGFYASLAGRDLPRAVLTSRMRRDAALFDLPPPRRPGQRGRPRKKGPRLPTPAQLARRTRDWRLVETEERGQKRKRLIHTRLVLWYAVCGTRPVRLVISRDPAGKEKDDFFFTTDLAAAPGATVGGFAGRWSIEDTFRNVKQYLRAEEPQAWKREGPARAAALGFLLYGLVWAWYLTHAHGRFPLVRRPWYGGKSRPSFQDALCALRKCLWQARISGLSGAPSLRAKIIDPLLAALASCA